MPYIKPSNREIYEDSLRKLLDDMSNNNVRKGEVTYLITRILVRYIKIRGKNYDSLSDIDAILGTASKEFYRKVTALYEDEKQKENDPFNEIYGGLLD